MKSLSLMCILIFLVIATSSLSIKSKFTKKATCTTTPQFNSNLWYKVYIISDTGKGIARCNNCGQGSYPDSAAVHGNIGDSWAIWKLYPGCNGQVAIRSVDTNKYLARCNKCWKKAAYPDSAFVHATNPNDSWAHWTMINNGDGTYSFKSDTGKYLARCNNCVTGGAKSDFAFVHATSNTGSWVRFKLVLA